MPQHVPLGPRGQGALDRGRVEGFRSGGVGQACGDVLILSEVVKRRHTHRNSQVRPLCFSRALLAFYSKKAQLRLRLLLYGHGVLFQR